MEREETYKSLSLIKELDSINNFISVRDIDRYLFNINKNNSHAP